MMTESQKRAQKKYYSKLENRKKKVEYMQEYRKRPYVKERYHEYYLSKIIQETSSERLHAENTEKFVKNAS